MNPASKPAQTKLKARFYQKSDFYKNPIFYKNPRGPGVGGLGGASIDPPDHLRGKGVLRTRYNLPSRKILDSKKSQDQARPLRRRRVWAPSPVSQKRDSRWGVSIKRGS